MSPLSRLRCDSLARVGGRLEVVPNRKRRKNEEKKEKNYDFGAAVNDKAQSPLATYDLDGGDCYDRHAPSTSRYDAAHALVPGGDPNGHLERAPSTVPDPVLVSMKIGAGRFRRGAYRVWLTEGVAGGSPSSNQNPQLLIRLEHQRKVDHFMDRRCCQGAWPVERLYRVIRRRCACAARRERGTAAGLIHRAKSGEDLRRGNRLEGEAVGVTERKLQERGMHEAVQRCLRST